MSRIRNFTVLRAGFIVFFAVRIYAVTVTPAELNFDCNPLEAQSAEPVISVQSVDAAAPVKPRNIPTKPFEFSRPSQKVTDEGMILDGISQSGMADVIVTLDYDLTELMPEPAASKIQYLQEQLMGKPAMLNAPMTRVYENVPAISMKVDQQTLDFLKTSELVAGIEPLLILEQHTAQGLPLMGADVYRSVYNGSGVSIAIVDSGIDYTHPALGGGGFPNAKVIGGYDFGNNDANPMPSGERHGTCVAGIAAGNVTNNPSYPNYIGGVSPGSKLYALKVMVDGSSSTDTGKLTSAIDWCVTHQNDDPANPILAINMSVGGGRYLSSCDSASSAMTNAVNAAVAAGITVLASSGNEGYCDAMGLPACVTNVISVGAVFDANVYTQSYCLDEFSCIGSTTGCTAPAKYYSTTTAADKVAPYSNSASFLDVLAPSNNASTPSLSGTYYNYFGGTSAACPYASGAVASLQSAALDIIGRFLTPSEVKAVLTQNGDPLEDYKNSIAKPRIDLASSIEFTDIFNGQQITVYNPSSTVTVSSITSPQWVTVYPQPPLSIARRQSITLYAQSDCDYCNYENLIGDIVISGSNFSETAAVNMSCPACELLANLNSGCAVDLADLAILTDCWLSSGTACQSADINSSGSVSLGDFAIMADEWLEGI